MNLMRMDEIRKNPDTNRKREIKETFDFLPDDALVHVSDEE